LGEPGGDALLADESRGHGSRSGNCLIEAWGGRSKELRTFAVVRGWLALRNSKIPPSLPAVWAKLGDLIRAEALASSITTLQGREQALAALAVAVADAGDVGQARRFIGAAEAAADSLTDHEGRRTADVLMMVDVAKALASTGDPDRAESIAFSIPYVFSAQGAAVGAVAAGLVAAGDVDRALQVVQRLKAGIWHRSTYHEYAAKVKALCALAEALAKAGDVGRARQVAQEAEAVARPTPLSAPSPV
jgi:hypothetical protein